MHKSFLHKIVFRFRRFCNKAYAAFASIHREVTIGRVAAYVGNLEMLKQGKHVAVMALLLMAPMGALAEEADDGSSGVPLTDADQLRLQEVVVVSEKAANHTHAYKVVSTISHDEIEALPITTVADILQYLPGLDVRTRGANGGQADLTMRGGTFDQIRVMINGVDLSDAHTGHYALNLPISPSLISRVVVMDGAIDIITNGSGDRLRLSLTGGMNGYIDAEASGRLEVDTKSQSTPWQLSGSVEYSRSDGYYAPDPSEKEATALANTDLRQANIFLQARHLDLNLQAGAQYKDAGAGMFYGFGSQDQFDATRTAFASVSDKWWLGNRFSLEAQAAYRANYDRYEWHRGQRLYGNFHLSQITSAALRAAYHSQIGATSLGIELRNENLHSTNLGDTINPDGQVPNVADFPLSDVRVLDLVKGGNRLDLRYFASQTVYWEGLAASLNVAGRYNTMFGHNWDFSANLGYEYLEGSKVYVNASRTLRLPTYTDLYYNAGNQLGNRYLKPETAYNLSAGANFTRGGDWGRFDMQADWWYRWGRNIIDWVYTPTDTKRPYHAENQQQVNATGVELTARYAMNNQWLPCVSLSYGFTHLDLDLHEAGSRYLDYLRHKVVLHIEHGIYVSDNPKVGTFGACWSLRYQDRMGEFNNAQGDVCQYEPVLLLDGSLYWQNSLVRLSADCTNLTNRRYYDYGGLLQPGAWAKLTLSVSLR